MSSLDKILGVGYHTKNPGVGLETRWTLEACNNALKCAYNWAQEINDTNRFVVRCL